MAPVEHPASKPLREFTLLVEGREYAEHLKSEGTGGYTIVQDLNDEIERLQRERDAYRTLAGIGLTGTDEADELVRMPPLDRDREAFSRVQQRGLASMKAAADAARAGHEPLTALPPAKQGRQGLGEIPAPVQSGESREAGEAAGGSAAQPQRAPHLREPPHCSTCSCGMATQPPGAKGDDNATTAVDRPSATRAGEAAASDGDLACPVVSPSSRVQIALRAIYDVTAEDGLQCRRLAAVERCSVCQRALPHHMAGCSALGE